MRTDLDFSNKGILDRIKNYCKINDTGCWIWQKSVNNRGRPVCSIKNKRGLVYRHTYKAFYDKELDSNTYICHRCDNPLCCNPEHLFEGDNRSNQLDYIAKNGKAKNGFNSGDRYTNTNLKRKNNKACPAKLRGLDRLNWYKNEAVEIDNKNCWIWQREVGQDGYGRVQYVGKKHCTHRLFWGLYYNKVEELDSIRDSGLVFRHLCNNKTCCNPKHVVPGSRSENALDSIKYEFEEPIEEWLGIYKIVLNETCNIERKQVAAGLRDLGLVSDKVSDRYVIDVLRGKNYKHIHRKFFDWTPDWK